MSDRRSSAELEVRLDSALSAFRAPDRDWEANARRVEARLSEQLRSSTDARLLAAPLPQEAGEPSLPVATATPLSNSGVRPQSLAELARRSVEKKQAADRELVQASMKLRAQSRDVRVPPSHEVPSRTRELAPPAPAARSNAAEPARPKRWSKLAFAVPVLACAAGVALWVHHAPTSGSLAVGTSTPTPVVVPSVAEPSETARAAHAPSADSPSGVDVHALATESESNRAASATGKVPLSATPAPPVANGPHQAEKLARAAGTTTSRSPSVRANGELAATATLPPDPSMRPADSTGGELAARPSTGAVQAALGSVISGARRCVAGDDAPSSAVVVFGSDGRVQHVTVSGPAAGKSSAACIEAQLGRARVQPFASPNFSVNATVRPD